MASPIEDISFESRIGAGTKVSGKMNFRGRVRIDGEADGELRGDEIVVSQGANVSAHINAARVSIAGNVTGDIVARERIEFLATARVKCTVTTPRFILNEGAQFDGECKMPQHAAASTATSSAESHPQAAQPQPAVQRLAATGGGRP
jgi:cytoskeletal protein CcmA (bactofilin family)